MNCQIAISIRHLWSPQAAREKNRRIMPKMHEPRLTLGTASTRSPVGTRTGSTTLPVSTRSPVGTRADVPPVSNRSPPAASTRSAAKAAGKAKLSEQLKAKQQAKPRDTAQAKHSGASTNGRLVNGRLVDGRLVKAAAAETANLKARKGIKAASHYATLAAQYEHRAVVHERLAWRGATLLSRFGAKLAEQKVGGRLDEKASIVWDWDRNKVPPWARHTHSRLTTCTTPCPLPTHFLPTSCHSLPARCPLATHSLPVPCRTAN